MSRRLQAAADELAAFRAKRDQTEPDLFSTIEAVVEAAGDVWRLEVLEAIVTIAKRKSVLTVEDITPLAPPTLDMRAIGGVLLDAQRRGYITKGGWVTSGRERHGRPVREWHSRVYRGDDAA
jgi:hypothetical protein